MYTAAELINVLQRRLRLTQYRSRPGEFPPAWQAWFDRMRDRAGAVTGATAEAIVAVLLQRPLAIPPRRALALNRWQAFATLWRQEWQPPAREERWLRALAAAVSALVHLVFALLLLWLGLIQLVVMGAPPRGEDTVVQVEFIGSGAPEQVGGGPLSQTPPEAEPLEPVPPPSSPPEQPAERTVAPPPPDLPPMPDVPVRTELPRLPPEQPQVVRREIPEPRPATEQPLAVSKPVPDRSSFVLPEPTVEVAEPEIAVPALRLPAPPMQAVDVPESPPEFRPSPPQLEVEQPRLRSEVPEVAVREVPAPLPRIELPPLPQPEPDVSMPELQARTPQVRERSIPAPRPASPSATQAKPSAADTAARPEQTAEPVVTTSPASEPRPATGAGPEPVPAPGGWPAPKVGDSWDLAEREEPGVQAGEPPGLYDSEGRVRLAEMPGSASPGLPPGTVTEEIADLDRAGTWLRRPPTDYEPTAFDRYWRPDETLLAEWVRRSITTVRIPIPGTGKSIVCKTMLLALGGACDIYDPNLNDQPATARPPPDIPFKPELQEGNGSAPAD